MPPPVIVYRYDASPYSVKVDNILTIKNIPHQKVNVSSILPRPEISELLGITYRRIPILAIGNDVYCDTSIITYALERRFPPSAGYGTIYPRTKSGDAVAGVAKAFSKLYDTLLFPVAANLIPWEKFPEAFLQDRSSLFGASINAERMMASRESSLTTLAGYLSLFEEQLQDGREWLLNTVSPSLADISFHFVLNWAKSFSPGKRLLDAGKFPYTVKWISKTSDYIEHIRATQPPVCEIAGNQAAASIAASPFEPYDVVGFNTSEAERLGIKLNDQVQVAPEDTGRNYHTMGKLVGINRDEVVIEVQGSEGLVRCHFPRIGFTVKAVNSHKL